MNEHNLSPIMEVAIEKKFDILEKSWDSKVFTKIYHSLRTSGLLAALSDKDFRTLICLSTFMDAEGHCFPSQEKLAQSLGITRTAVTKRMKSLLAFRWQGDPLVSARKVRSLNGKYERNIYSVLPESSLSIFDSNKSKTSHVNNRHVAGSHHNYSKTNKQEYNTVTENKSSNIDPLALQLANEMGDTRSLAYYRSVVRDFPASILLRARGEVLEEKNIKKSRGAMFAHLVKKHTGALNAAKSEA